MMMHYEYQPREWNQLRKVCSESTYLVMDEHLRQLREMTRNLMDEGAPGGEDLSKLATYFTWAAMTIARLKEQA